jgi:topoisomerase-4 subunit B
MTMLHSGGKFSGKAYETSGGLHGVGVSVVNALSERVDVTVWRDGFEWRQASRGKPLGPLEQPGPSRKKGTDHLPARPEIFGEGAAFKPARLYRMARSKAYLFRGVEIRWKCDPSRIHDATPPRRPSTSPTAWPTSWPSAPRARDRHARGLRGRIERKARPAPSNGPSPGPRAGFGEADGFMQSYCNTVPTPEGGTHEAGLRAALTRGLKAYAELTGEKRGGIITADDVISPRPAP